MPLRPLSLVAGFALLATASGAEEAGPRRESAARASVREHIKANLPAFAPTAPPPTATGSPILNVTADSAPPRVDLITMAPVIVFRPRVLSKAELTAALRKEDSVKSNAVYSKDLTKTVRIEFLLPPEGGSMGGLALPLFRLSW